MRDTVPCDLSQCRRSVSSVEWTSGDFFGTKNLGVNYGLLFTAWGVAGIIGPIIAGRLFDIFGNYTNAFYVGLGICVLALGSLLLGKLSRRWRLINVSVARRTFDGIPSNIRVALRTAFHMDPATPGEFAVPLGIQMGFYRFIENPISEITNSSKQ